MKPLKSDMFSFHKRNQSYCLSPQTNVNIIQRDDVKLKRASWTDLPNTNYVLGLTNEKGVKYNEENKSEQLISKLICTPNGVSMSGNDISEIYVESSDSDGEECFNPVMFKFIQNNNETNDYLNRKPSQIKFDSKPQTKNHIKHSFSFPYSLALSKSASSILNKLNSSLGISKADKQFAKQGSTFLEEEMEDDVLNTPKILYAHRKGNDSGRRTRKQLEWELRQRRKQNVLKLSSPLKKTNAVNLTSVQKSRSLDGYCRSNFKVIENYSHYVNERDLNSSLISSPINVTNLKHYDVSQQHPVEGRASCHVVNSYSNSFIEESHTLKTLNNTDILHKEGQIEHLVSNIDKYYDIIAEEDSDVDMDGVALCFEDQMENNLEKINNCSHSEDNCSILNSNKSHYSPIYTNEEVKSEIKSIEKNLMDDRTYGISLREKRSLKSPNLKLDLKKTAMRQNSVKRRLLEAHCDSASEEYNVTSNRSSRSASTKSSPGTPRSPVIDIDDVFEQKCKALLNKESSGISTVKEIAQRLGLPSVLCVSSLPNVTNNEELSFTRDVKEDTEVLQRTSKDTEDLQRTSKDTEDLQRTSKDTEDLQRTSKDTEDLQRTFEKGNNIQNPIEEDEDNGRRREMCHRPNQDDEHVMRKKKLSGAISWIKGELQTMQQQDQCLSRQLLQLQLDLQRLKLVWSCDRHQSLLQEVTYEEEERHRLTQKELTFDVPILDGDIIAPSLKQIGLTRMDLSNRRFSLR